MKTYDISLAITENLPVWPGDPKPGIQQIQSIENGADSNVTKISMSVHLGTHIDAPFHYLGGKTDTVDKIPLDVLIGRAFVVEIDDQYGAIDREVFERVTIPPRTRRVLFKTRNSRLWDGPPTGFKKDYVAILTNGAQYLVERGIKLVGVDYLSVAPFESPNETHQVLLQAGVVVIEGLNLSKVPAGRYTLYCLPLKIEGADGAPARVILKA